jgi:hypothetical protein
MNWISVKNKIPEEGERVLIRCDGVVTSDKSLRFSFGTISRPWNIDPEKYQECFLIICTENDQKEHDVREDEQDMWYWMRL